MAEDSKGISPMVKWGLIIGGIVFLLMGVLAVAFIFFLPPMFTDAVEADIPEVVLRMGVVFGIFIVGIVLLAAIAYVIYALFFKKKELHIVKEHAKIIKESAQLNPVSTLRNLILTGKGQIQNYAVGRVIGHTQVPVKFERYILRNRDGNEYTIKNNDGEEIVFSETPEEFEARVIQAKAEGRDRYDFFAFITGRGFYALPILSLLEPVRIFACYPCERSPDLVGDVEVYDVGVWKYYGINVPAQRAQEPMSTLEDFKNQIMPIAMTSLMDYIGLVAQRGIEGDTSMQKWIESKASMVNVKQNP